VLYLFLAAIATCTTMIYVANRMQARPNKVQTAVETLYQGLMRDNITGGNLDEKMAKRWFPFIATLFLFILFSNLVGYIPLPTNTEHKIDIFGASHPVVLALRRDGEPLDPARAGAVVFVSYTYEGDPQEGSDRLPEGLIPGGVHGPDGRFHLRARGPLERDAADVALDSSVREHPRRPPDHPVHGRRARRDPRGRGAGLVHAPVRRRAVRLRGGLVAALQAFIFATLTAIYLGGAVADDH
jgi:F-type H+-transporting ATPase subunit a